MCIDKCRSSLVNVQVGVAQGVLLGVLMFSLVINDVFRSLKFVTSILYADDTTLLISGKLLKFLKRKMQCDLNHLSEWLCMNQLKLNVSKTKIMLLTREGLTPEIH